ncbi:MAG TPA: lamin tail domain-containing protein, partial [Pyrinomonadaceae bacterium]
PLMSSPASSTNFQGEFDQAKGGGPSGVFITPPDTMGAVGLDKVVSYLNNNIVVHDKVSGAVLSLVSIESFWASTGATQVFDPRIQYDPYNNRWLIAAISNAQNANSSVLIGVSDSPDPQGTFSLYRFNVGCAPGSPGCSAQGEWADFPMLGFNKNWVAVAWNQFTINGGSFLDGQLLVLDYPSLRGGVANSTLFSGVSAANAGFCMHPAATYSATENTLYLPSHQSSSEAAYRLHTITGTSEAPVFTVGALQTRPGGAWVQPGGDILPQHCVPAVGGAMHACPATIRGIDTADAFIRSNVVFRNGKIYYPQTIGLPSSGLTHTAAQWTVLSPDGTFFDGGRIEDLTATNSNGGKWYAYPSLSVNKNNDILFGFSEFESDDYADAGYTFRLGGDPPGTMRDPVIYKEGEDYYEKTFAGTRNRWGDYSHSVVDPVNDRDLWTVQEYAMLRQGTTGLGSNDSRWGTWWAKITAPAGPGDLLISEFRLRGPDGSTDEFVEILNPNSTPLTVQTVDGSAGYSLVASDGVSRFTVPNGTVIPARGHYLGVNSASYSLSGYPAGNGTSASGDTTYTTDIPDNAGIALFNSSTAANFILGNRLDAAGSTNEANTLYREGSGYPALAIANLSYSFVRTFCPNNFGVFGTALGCTPNGGAAAKDSNDNAADFLFIDTNFMNVGAGQRLGAPGPENLSVPTEQTTLFAVHSLDATASTSGAPNRVRDLTSDPANNATFGTMGIRRRLVNGTGGPVTRLRFRIVDITNVPAPAGFADLRARTSALVSVSGVNDSMTCSPAPTPCTVNVQGTTMEEPPSQVNGGGFSTSLSAGTITLATPLAPGASINLQFLYGVQQTGSFRVFLIVEALP